LYRYMIVMGHDHDCDHKDKTVKVFSN